MSLRFEILNSIPYPSTENNWNNTIEFNSEFIYEISKDFFVVNISNWNAYELIFSRIPLSHMDFEW